PVVVNFPVGDLFPAAELSGRLQAPVQVPVAFHNGVPVLVPGVAETRLVLMPVIKPRVRDVTPDGISQLAGPVVPYNGCVVTLVGIRIQVFVGQAESGFRRNQDVVSCSGQTGPFPLEIVQGNQQAVVQETRVHTHVKDTGLYPGKRSDRKSPGRRSDYVFSVKNRSTRVVIVSPQIIEWSIYIAQVVVTQQAVRCTDLQVIEHIGHASPFPEILFGNTPSGRNRREETPAITRREFPGTVVTGRKLQQVLVR